jgi:hypothetical protein
MFYVFEGVYGYILRFLRLAVHLPPKGLAAHFFKKPDPLFEKT